MKRITLFFLFFVKFADCQTIGESIPVVITNSDKYLFYLHGAVVTELGNNAVNQSVPEWGPYEFYNILDSLGKRGFNVISEIRKKGIKDSFYVEKIFRQIDSLLIAGALPENIFLVGASAGMDITLAVSSKMKNSKMNFVIVGGCWPSTHEQYADLDLWGNFLSIIEQTDPHGTCYRIFERRSKIESFKEIVLNTGLSHGFIYKGYEEWIDPIVAWFNKLNQLR